MTGRKTSTRLVHSGRSKSRFDGSVGPRITRSSTVLLPDIDALYDSGRQTYGRIGHEVHRVLEEGLCELEGAEYAFLTQNGVSACTIAVTALCKSGDHVLFPDSAYGPTRRFCQRFLKRMGVSTNSYPSGIGAEIADYIKPETSVIFIETPGSLTFDFPDVPAIADIAKSMGILTVLDNTWAAGVLFQPLKAGVDVSVQALTKYVMGHADAFGGAIMTRNARLADRIRATTLDLGQSCGPEEAYTAQRGLRTLDMRMKHHEASALQVASWLEARSDVVQMLHPALDSHPDHYIWKRDFSGSNGLFSFVLPNLENSQLKAFFEGFELFGFGFSWGGFESLVLPCNPQLRRDHPTRLPESYGELVRIHIGLEDADDLIGDLDRAFRRAAHA